MDFFELFELIERRDPEVYARLQTRSNRWKSGDRTDCPANRANRERSVPAPIQPNRKH